MKSSWLLLAAAAVLSTGCSRDGAAERTKMADSLPRPDTSLNDQSSAVSGAARIEFQDQKGNAVGEGSIAAEGEGVRITGQVRNLPAGTHGMHLHEVGRCDPPDFTTAGGHFNPGGKEHGEKNPKGPHMGDLGNLEVGSNGEGNINVVAKGVTLDAGGNSLFHEGGTALVIHAKADDMKTNPSGNSGNRITCGVVTRLASGIVRP